MNAPSSVSIHSARRLARCSLSSLAFATVLAISSLLAAAPARAQETEAQREANVHFQRAVTLYAEADYKGALVEFKRAQEIAPHVTVLYNLGQTYYQLQSYADAQATFERFLAEGGTAHRAEVENAVLVLRTRVGKLDVTSPTPGWEIAVDDETVGKTPLAKPIGVSIGKRRVSASKPGEPTQTRVVEVSAGDTIALVLGGMPLARAAPSATVGPDRDAGPREKKGNGAVIAGWVGTGVLTAGAVVSGILATSAASDLDDARARFPGDATDIDAKASTTTALSVTTDILVGSALIVAGISLYLTLKNTGGPGNAGAPVRSAPRLGGRPGPFILGGTF